MRPLPDNFRYLNREGRWLDFHWSGLERADDGALQLLSSPRLVGPAKDFPDLPAPLAPSGVAVDRSGRIFFTVPEANQLFGIAAGSSEATPLRCAMLSPGLGSFDHPRGLMIIDDPERLVVVDSGNHRLLFFDLSLELREIWGQEDVAARPAPGSGPGQFDTPWTISTDGAGNLYVLDYGNRRVQKFRKEAEPDLQFAEQMAQSGLLHRPAALAVVGKGTEASVFVFDLDTEAIYVFDATGAPVRDSDGEAVAIRHEGMTQVLALAADGSALYAGDNHLRRVLSFHRSPAFPFSGEAAGFEGPVAAIGMDPSGGILIALGGQRAPLRMSASGAYLPSGVLWSEAISSGAPARWSRLRAYVQRPAGVHIEFYYATADSATPPPVDPSAADPFGDARWTELPNEVEDFLLNGNKAAFLFVGVIFRGDQATTPRLKQMRAEFEDPGYLQYLPAIFRQPDAIYEPVPDADGNVPARKRPDAEFLRRFLMLLEGVFNDLELEIESLPRYFNPYAAPAETLPWLATWLAVELDQGEPLARIRAAIAQAFRRYQWRGTAEGLQRALLEDAGVHANIIQPLATASFWAFPGDTHCSGVPSTPAGARLGTTTNLPGVQPGGAVLGRTAQLDHSYLVTDQEFGEPLFDGAAYQFVVEVYRNEVASQARLALVREIVEREKPAHTMWRLAIIEPTMRVGLQDSIGVDGVVAGPPVARGLGVATDAPGGVLLAGGPPLRIGLSRLGQELKLQE